MGNFERRRGQSIMLAVFAIGATLLGAATVAGLLLFYQIRQATDLASSNQAIYASDSGGEWGLYQFFKVASSSLSPTPLPTLSNSASAFSVDCYDDQGNIITPSSNYPDPCASASTTTVVSQGVDSTGQARRTLRLDILAVKIGS